MEFPKQEMKKKPEEINVSILSTCKKYRTSCHKRKGTILHSCDWTFAPAAPISVGPGYGPCMGVHANSVYASL